MLQPFKRYQDKHLNLVSPYFFPFVMLFSVLTVTLWTEKRALLHYTAAGVLSQLGVTEEFGAERLSCAYASHKYR